MAGPGTHTTAARQDCDGSRSVSSGQASYQASTVAIGGYRWRRADKSRYRAFPAKAESQYGLWVMHTATGSPHSHSTPSTGITANGPAASTSARHYPSASNSSLPQTTLHPLRLVKEVMLTPELTTPGADPRIDDKNTRYHAPQEVHRRTLSSIDHQT